MMKENNITLELETSYAVMEVFTESYNKFGFTKLMYHERYSKGELPFGLVDFL